jgi:hypothetical protein
MSRILSTWLEKEMVEAYEDQFEKKKEVIS